MYSNWREIEDKETGEIISKPFLKYYTVFNLEQTDGIVYPAVEFPDVPVDERCEAIWNNMPNKPQLFFDSKESNYYQPKTDSIHLVPRQYFFSSEAFYTTLWHECAHATGHESRLNRTGVMTDTRFGSDVYSKEELVAELSVCFIASGKVGIPQQALEDSASYIASWLKVLKNDNRMIVFAASQAEKAAQYILNEQKEENEDDKGSEPSGDIAA
ncbi:MAG: antirestriction protein [Deltaproteobacteria bacterium]|nr:antirestriction protein [Deltaproteobacteria bacterium]